VLRAARGQAFSCGHLPIIKENEPCTCFELLAFATSFVPSSGASIRKAAINEANRQGRNATEFAGHSDPKTTKKHYLNEPVKVKPIR
jgi:hypothetical protein